MAQRHTAVTSKEMLLKAYKISRGDVDRRGRAVMTFDMLMHTEESFRGTSPKPRRPQK